MRHELLNKVKNWTLTIGMVMSLASIFGGVYVAYSIATLKPGEKTAAPIGVVKKDTKELVSAHRKDSTNEIVLTMSDGSTITVKAPDFQVINGRDGSKGTDGLKGDKGDKGDKGEQGVKGDKGDKGDKGERGEKGKDGVDGAPGMPGAQGAQGAQGDPGPEGPAGPSGRNGVDGMILRCVNRTSTEADILVSDNGGTRWRILLSVTGQCK